MHADASLLEQQKIADAILEGCRAIHALILEHEAMTEVLKRRGFVFDVLEDAGTQEVQLIELNESGARSGCGSCLFHWIRDARLLYGREEMVEVRLAV